MATVCYCYQLFHLLILLPFLLLPSSTIAQPFKNVTLGSSLTAQNNDSFWLSKSADFAFGFLQLGTEGFLLAIWFNKIPEKTVIWSANRDQLVPRGSILQLTTRGRFELNDPTGQPTWSANLTANNGSVSYAAILDNGNFVLAANDSQVLWQSFNDPTDTILPSQTVDMGQTLIARLSETNYSSGRFQLSMKNDGNLVLYHMILPTDHLGTSYWESDTAGSGFQLLFDLFGSISIIAQNRTILRPLTSNTPSTQNFYHRAILKHDGVFRQYVYPKNNNGSGSDASWSLVSNSSIPSNICTTLNGGGSGACGFNSYCSIGTEQRPNCSCPQGYDMADPNDVMRGCKPRFIPQSCYEPFPQIDAFEFSILDNTDFPWGDYEEFESVNEDWCRNSCLSDCFCAAAVSRNEHCWKKKFPLSLGRMDPSVGGKALIKIRKQNATSKPNDVGRKDRDKTLIVIGSVLLTSSAFLFFISLVTFLFVHRFHKKKSKVVLQGADPLFPGLNLTVFSYKELNKATSGFKDKLGYGSFSTVYKGIIDSMDNKLVAVKKLDNMVREGDQEFKAEVSAIARTNHKNLVRLLGFCNEGEHRMLVYEFMQNGSLAGFLFGPSRPNWLQRIEVALGTARGLCYLHEECNTQIIHCDIKPHNILLDDLLDAKISDFGLAKLLKRNQTRTMTAIRGTKGYVAPEWFKSLPITVKVDVYSFGILLLEIICCRKSFEAEAKNESEMVLVDWAYDCFREEKVKMLVESDEEAKNDMERIEKFVMIAIWCIQEEPSLRPTMKKVVQMLEGDVQVSIPPDPSSSISAVQ